MRKKLHNNYYTSSSIDPLKNKCLKAVEALLHNTA